ncbi:hypothetical protein [Vibrio harveyi]|uniref:hypothetical protein n=1 Tax=Vibrio harveyi TaxID=669 RepID=UPI00237DCF19|nr:hypothetical protein [Vibrio harveyi]HDM8061679.1 hypothetical protein [Vibrio harveyi]
MRYTEPEDEFIHKNGTTMLASEIGKTLGRSRLSVVRRAGRIGANLKKAKDYSPEEDEVIRTHAKKKSAAEIGKIINRSAGSVQARAMVINVSMIKHGEYHHKSKYSNDDVRLVRELLMDGTLTHQEIADKMDMTVHNVNLISVGGTRNSDGV